MAKFFVEGNGEGAKLLFEKRIRYRDAANAPMDRDISVVDPTVFTHPTLGPGAAVHENLVDFNYGEKFFYGRVNRFFVPVTVNENNSFVVQKDGLTSHNANHIHKYQVDPSGNGWALEAVHRDEPRIRHRHRIIDGVVQEAQSGCYPNCKERYGVGGAPPHVHTLLDKGSKTTEVPQMKRFSPKITMDINASALNFVVDAFSDLALQFQKNVLLKKISTKDEFLSTLTVHKAYQSPKALYGEHREIYFDVIVEQFKKRKIKVKNFHEFTYHLLMMLEKSLHRNPITKPAFIKSKRCSLRASGLVIEIADLDPANDQKKIDQFVRSLNWDFYVRACASYGFMVDEFVPWRLIADIGSSPTRSAIFEYAEKYGLNSTDDIIEKVYEPVHTNYYEMFKNNLLRLYNRVKPKKIVETIHGDHGKMKYSMFPASYTPSSLDAKYPPEYCLKLYFKIRFLEEESQFTDNQKAHLINDCIQIYLKNHEIQEAMDAFEKNLNKTFDYRGSIGYIKKHDNAVEAEDSEEQGEIGTTSMGTSQGY